MDEDGDVDFDTLSGHENLWTGEVVLYIDRWVLRDVRLRELIGVVNVWKGL